MAEKLLPRAGNEQLIPEMDEQFLSNLDAQLIRQEMQAIERIGGEQESRGFFRSGNTQRRLTEEVLGPSLERRQQALLPLARESALMGREERMGDVAFDRQRQFAQEQFERQMDAMSQQLEMQKILLQFQEDLSGGGFLEDFLAPLAGGAIGAFTGGFGGAAGFGLARSLFGGGGGGGGGRGRIPGNSLLNLDDQYGWGD